MSTDLTKSIQKLGDILRSKVDSADISTETLPQEINKTTNKGKSSTKIAKIAEKKLLNFITDFNIEQFELFPSREYPTPLSRIPLFTPSQRNKARELEIEKTKDTDFIRLNSTWDKGGVYKSGPTLTVYDEDTFIGLLLLRKSALKGKPSKMPSKHMNHTGSTISNNNEKDVLVHSGYFLISELETKIRGTKPPKAGWGGEALKNRRDSVERLGATILKFTQPQNLDKYRGKQIQIVSIDWVSSDKEAYYYFEFHPAIALWLTEFRTYIDFGIRRQLTPFGKALHRFLSSQKSNKFYKKDWEDILVAIGFNGRTSEAKRKGISELNKLVKLGFIKSGSIEGNGRSEAFVMHISF